FSSDARFAGAHRFEGSPRLEQEDITDAEGGAALVLNPGAETTAQPRTYVIEATVTGADDQTVTAVQQVVAVPPFVLGLLAPRFLANATTIEPQVLVLGVDDKPLAGLPVTVRLKHRQWHSVLQASDFAQGQARYLTDVVDEQISETTVTSGTEAIVVPLTIHTAGVYIVELEAADRLGRSQVVSVDLYAGGPEPVSWPKPATPVFTMASDKPAYDPGDTAKLVLQSPFQVARALLVVEAPEGNQYRWVNVSGGAATVEVPVLPTFVPRLPVHAVLMRGRVGGSAPAAGSTADLGKPTTMAATTWLAVNAVSNRVEVTLAHPERALPGSKVEVTIRLADPKGHPLPGEVTLWLVDAAVLALGREQRLDPLPDFIDPVRSRLTVRDTRNLAFGELAFAELPGGDEGEEGGLLERTTVRRNFKSVPYYNPAIQVGPDGVTTVTVELPDNLTVFKLRAKAASGPDRFGVGVSQIAVRLPVIVQPALPRFVRPGDRFTAAAIGRVVEGEGGPGKAEWQVDGVTLDGSANRDLAWVPNQPLRIDFPVTVTTPEVDAGGKLSRQDVTFRVAVARTADGARDAFEVKLPIQPDRARMAVRQMQELEVGKPLLVPAVPDQPRPGTVRRTLVLSEQAGLVRMAAGLSFLLDYPYGCTEQRLSRTRAQVAMARLRGLLEQDGGEEKLQRSVADTLDWIARAVDGQGLVAYWPGGPGYVSLTAWTVQFLVEAREAGYTVDPKLLDRLTHTLEQALRSDFSRFIDGESFAERCWALVALVQAGKSQPAYAAELARKAEYLDLEATAEVLHAYARSGEAGSPAARDLTVRMWDGIVTRLHQGKEIYGGLQGRTSARSARILPSETRTVAEVTRAVIQSDAKSPRLQVLVDGLVTLGRDDGWGSTNANAAALLALSELLKPPFAGATKRQVQVRFGVDRRLDLGPDSPLVTFKVNSPAAGEITLQPGAGRPVVARLETTWVPAADGSQVSPQANGFVVSRELLRQRGEDAPPDRIALATAGTTVELAVGDVVEEHVQVINPSDRAYVAVVTPLAAGCEPLNPALATAPPEARAKGTMTLAPTYVGFMDDQVAFYYDWLPKGTYDFYFRTRATVAGEYIQPPARAEMMYDAATWGQGAGARVVVRPVAGK
ncbi:MAG TPA: alpha-2-macroglobulin family protein, partial [Thermoanaerobaculaceae bacterium]|nr:alpha-2-macroglobulin family protein [Thermoanaerobaculaceae bacterium]